jgi:hypothetical protein
MRRCLSTLFVSLLMLMPAAAQVSGRITGSIVDQTGAAVPGAKLTLRLPGGSTTVIQTQTTAEGLFEISSVRPDFYDLLVEAPGFTPLKLARVKVDASKETALTQLKLEVAAASQAVEVRESVAAVQTTTAEVVTTVTQAQVDHLPVLDRQVQALFITQAGVTQSRTNTTINGLRPSYANLLLDGVNIQDSVRSNPLDYIPNRLTIGQIAEATFSTSNSNSTIGGNATTISLSTPSGTNEFHGNAYWYNRNSYFGANDWFNNKNGVGRPFLNLNQIGGTIGGPILKDKLLFYSNYEAYRFRSTTPITTTILTPEARQGNFRYRDATGAVQTYNVMAGKGIAIDPFMQNLLSQVPSTGNSTDVGDGLNTTGYAFNARDNETRDNVIGKLDYYLNSKNSFSGSYIWNRDPVDRPDQGTFYTVVPPVFNNIQTNFMSTSWRWNPKPTITNELRGGFNRTSGTFETRQQDPAFFVANTNFSNPVNATRPESRDTHTYSIQDNVNWIKGRHSLSFGFQAMLQRVAVSLFAGNIPAYGLGISLNGIPGYTAGQIPGASTTDIGRANALYFTLGGLVKTSGQTFNVASRTSGFVPGAPQLQNSSLNNYAPYITDTWKVLPRLSLTFGLRWEYWAPVDIKDALIVQPRVASGNPVEALLGNATLDFAGNAVGRPLYKKDKNNFAPNFGFAWDVFGKGRTSIRGGYSVAFANDNLINDVYIVGSANNGLTSTINGDNLNGRVTGNLPAIRTPAFQLPSTTLAQFELTPNSPPVQGLIDPNLATPYVQQWNLSIQQEYKGFVFEGRYVGNHAVKQLRQIDFNQVNVKQDTFLQDFISARNNGFLALAAGRGFDPRFNAAVAGSRPTPFFDRLPGGGFLTNALVTAPLQSGEIGNLAQTYQANLIFPGDNPNFSFFPNPLLLYSSMLTNISNSSYNAAQFEVRRRTARDVQFQANYTFSKALSDAAATRGLEAQLDNSSARVERARAPYDLTHQFRVNHYYPRPFGPGHRMNPGNRILRKFAEGWALSGILRVESGPPVSILSARGTLNRGARSGPNTVDTTSTLSQLNEAVGFFMTGNGPYFVNPRHIGSDGRGAAPDGRAAFDGQIFFNPQPGALGSLQRRILSGTWYNNYNIAVHKKVKVTERQSVEFRADFYNPFNHPNFFVGDQNINNTNFGKITQQYYTIDGIGPRMMQFGLFYKF